MQHLLLNTGPQHLSPLSSLVLSRVSPAQPLFLSLVSVSVYAVCVPARSLLSPGTADVRVMLIIMLSEEEIMLQQLRCSVLIS
jgi:hypothetical protein